MKKQELIHLHGLLAEVRQNYEERTGTTTDYDHYEQVGVGPTAIHRSKTVHKEAVFALADDLTDEMTTEAELVSAAAD